MGTGGSTLTWTRRAPSATRSWVRQIMRSEGLVACQPRPFRVTNEADAEAAADMPDLVRRDPVRRCSAIGACRPCYCAGTLAIPGARKRFPVTRSETPSRSR